MSDSEIFAARVREVLEMKKWDPMDLAYHLGLKNPVSVKRWAKGQCFPDVPTISRMGNLVGQPTSWFFTAPSNMLMKTCRNFLAAAFPVGIAGPILQGC